MVRCFTGSVSRYCYPSIAVVKMATERTTRDFSLMAFALAMAGCATSPDVFDVNRSQAVKNPQTPEGKAYVQAFYPAIGQDLISLRRKWIRRAHVQDRSLGRIESRAGKAGDRPDDLRGHGVLVFHVSSSQQEVRKNRPRGPHAHLDR